MAGAIAGTAILKAAGKRNLLNTVTITVNNDCNLHCRHCYLQYKSNNGLISDGTLESVFKADFRHIAIVGREPLYNQASIGMVSRIVREAERTGKTVSLVTNGLNLREIPEPAIGLIDYVDISFDGGFSSYWQYRNGDLRKVLDGAAYLHSHGLGEINALHTVSNLTLNYVSDCIGLKDEVAFTNIMFSPYLKTDSQGYNRVEAVPLPDILETLAGNALFKDTPNAFLLVDTYHLEQDGMSTPDFEKLVERYHLGQKVKLYREDPLHYGFIRVTFDDIVLPPRMSLHTNRYGSTERRAAGSDLNMLYQELLEEETRYAV